MADFKNDRRFTLRCLDSNIIPVSLRLKSNIRTPRAINIIKKTERLLLNERVRTINSTIEILECQCHTCRSDLNKVLDRDIMEECDKIMVKIREDRHQKTLERQKQNWTGSCTGRACKQRWPLKQTKIHISQQ